MYGTKEARIAKSTKPRVSMCAQCEDTGFLVTEFGHLRECPLCCDAEDGDDVPLGTRV